MAGWKFKKDAWTALAGLAVVSMATPATARPNADWQRDGGEPRNGNAERAAERATWRQQPQAAPAASREAPPARQANQWRVGDNARPDAARPAPATPPQNWRQRNEGASGAVWGMAPTGTRPVRDNSANRENWRSGDRDRTGRNDANRGSWNSGDRNRDQRDRTQAQQNQRDRNDYRWSGDNTRRGDRDRQAWNGRDNDHHWDRDWRRDRRYDWRDYRRSHRDIYRVRPYYAPYRDYYYRRLSIGFYLDALFFGQDYWIGDPGYYRLPPVYGPYRWVRYYDDALLVNIYTGEVVDVIYDFFW